MASEVVPTYLDRDCLPAAPPLKISYYHGTTKTPLSGVTIGQLLEEAAHGKPDHVAFRIPEFNKTFTLKQLLKQADALSKGFLAMGLSKGDIIYCAGLRDDHFITIFLACANIGLIFYQPVLYTPKDVFLKETLDKSQPALVISDLDWDDPAFTFLLSLQNTQTPEDALVFERPKTLKDIYVVENRTEEGSFTTVNDLLERGTLLQKDMLEKAKKIVSIDDCAAIATTSGTSGEADCVCLSHFHLVNFAESGVVRRTQGKKEVIGYLSADIDDILLLHGTMEIIAYWREGSVGVVLPTSVGMAESSALPFLQTIDKERLTKLSCYPFQLLCLLNSPECGNYDLSSVQGAILVSQIVSPEAREKLIAKFPDSVVAYGQSECLAIACSLPGLKGREGTLTSGYPIAHNEVKVVGKHGEILPVGETGEILVRGPYRFLGYLRNQKRTQEVLDMQGWIHTGDMASMDVEGYITIVGRKADCIRYKHKGEVVYPGHIEDVVKEHEDVQDAKVLGIPEVDERLGDTICACVIPKSGASITKEDLRRFCDNRLLSRDRPELYFIMHSFPKVGARQKVSRTKLKAIIVEKLQEAGSR